MPISKIGLSYANEEPTAECTDPQMLDQKSNDWRSVFLYKYSFEFKKKVVLVYLNGEGSFQTIANKYEVPSWGNVKKWVRSYEKFGDDEKLYITENNTREDWFREEITATTTQSDIQAAWGWLEQGL